MLERPLSHYWTSPLIIDLLLTIHWSIKLLSIWVIMKLIILNFLLTITNWFRVLPIFRWHIDQYSFLFWPSQAGDCPGGYYCPEGTADAYENPCPASFYLNASAGEDSQGCTLCIAGYYCPEEGLAWPYECPRVCTSLKGWRHCLLWQNSDF